MSDERLRRLWRATVPFASTESVLDGYKLYSMALRNVSSRYQVPFLPMAELGIAGSDFYVPDDPIHFNDLGADRFAEGLARRLLEGNLLPAP